MPGEITMASVLVAKKGDVQVEVKTGISESGGRDIITGQQFNWSGNVPSELVQNVGLNMHEPLAINSDIVTPGVCVLRNLVAGCLMKLGLEEEVLSTPGTPTISPQGVTGATSYSYRVAAIDAEGVTLASTAGTTSSGNATLSVSNFNRVTWSAVTNATGYKIYGRTSGAELLIATVGAVTQYDDTGAVTPAGAVPSQNSTGFKPCDLLPYRFPVTKYLPHKNFFIRAYYLEGQAAVTVLDA